MADTLAEDGAPFLLPPHHRLLVVFDDPDEGQKAIGRLASIGKTPHDIWKFFGEPGAHNVEPEIFHHGLPSMVVRVLQHIYTNDREYASSLADALRGGAMVLAVVAEPEEADELSLMLAENGGHSVAYGDHRTFMPLEGSGSAIGRFGAQTDRRHPKAS